MLRNLFAICFSVCLFPFFAFAVNPTTSELPNFNHLNQNPKQELALIDNLIEVTEKNLTRQRKLKREINEYIALQERYMKNTNDKDLGYQLVKAAKDVLEGIKDQNLTQVFDAQFMSELSFFSNIAEKWNSPRL